MILAFPCIMRPLHNTRAVIASEAKQSHDLFAFHEIATSLKLLATKKQLCKGFIMSDRRLTIVYKDYMQLSGVRFSGMVNV